MNNAILDAVSIFRTSPNLSDEQIYLELVDRGFERQLAARLVELLPSAYCRLVLAESGVQFSDMFTRKLPDGAFQERALSSEPLWNPIMAFAQAEVERGVTKGDLFPLAARSAEFNAINNLLQMGSKLKDIRCTPILFPWPEEGPDHRG